MGKIISLVNQKGGVGKTTTSINLSASLALLGKKILLIDLDPQGNATTGVGVNKGDIDNSVYDLLTNKCTTSEVIVKTSFHNLDIIPSTIQLAGIDIEFIEKSKSDSSFKRAFQLKEKLEKVKDNYDYIIIDCPPSLGIITTNALTCSNSVIIPVQCEFFALEGITQLLNTIMLTQKNLNPNLDLEGVLLTMLSKSNLGLDVIEEIRSYFKDRVYDTIIPRLIRLAEAPSHGKPIVAYDPKSKGSEAYINLAKEVIMAEMETTRRRALGRGLEELFSGEVLDFDSIEEKIIEETPKEEIIQVKLSELRSNPYQPRKVFDEKALSELASSIKEHGVFQPIIIKRSIKGYEIVAGERRVKASILAGRETIHAIVRDFNDQEMMEIALLENLQREDLNPIEEAMAYQNLMEARGLNHEQLASRIGKSRSYVTNMVGLMNLPDSVKELVIARKISATHARTLSKIKDQAKVEELADRIINEGLTTAAIEELAQDKTVEKRNKMERHETEENRTYKYIQDLLCDRLSTKVRIRGTKIEINFQDLADFNRIIEALKLGE